ncbi:MAG TPA: zinc transporter ZupT [Candidatus Gastranaerophilales bacterium]|nr:zinc transporter ZupT [Candidatus Gastranaerophilales bacterium]
MDNNILFAFSLTLFAGLTTGIGGILAFFIKKENLTALSLGLGFSAGVMIYVSFIEIIKKAESSMISVLGENLGSWLAIMAFFAGIAIAFAVDWFLPENINQDELSVEKDEKNPNLYSQKLHRMGIFTAMAIAIHNFPEGLATFMAGLSNPTLGISIAVAIAIHNIPEGIAVSLPIYNVTGSKKKAFLYSALSGLAEPLGAILGYTLLRFLFNDLTFGILFAVVAGIMIYISFDELLPAAREYGKGHITILGLTLGMLVMAVSLQLF